METLFRFIDNIVILIINPLLVLLFALALVFFLWNGAQFILNANESEARKKGKQGLIWGLVGLFIIVTVYGILGAVTATFGVPLPR